MKSANGDEVERNGIKIANVAIHWQNRASGFASGSIHRSFGRVVAQLEQRGKPRPLLGGLLCADELPYRMPTRMDLLKTSQGARKKQRSNTTNQQCGDCAWVKNHEVFFSWRR